MDIFEPFFETFENLETFFIQKIKFRDIFNNLAFMFILYLHQM